MSFEDELKSLKIVMRPMPSMTERETLESDWMVAQMSCQHELHCDLRTDHILRQDQAKDICFDASRWPVHLAWIDQRFRDCQEPESRAMVLVDIHFEKKIDQLVKRTRSEP